MYYVIKQINDVIYYKRCKCTDSWSSNKLICWKFTKQGAKAIADRLNARINRANKHFIHYDILKAEL